LFTKIQHKQAANRTTLLIFLGLYDILKNFSKPIISLQCVPEFLASELPICKEGTSAIAVEKHSSKNFDILLKFEDHQVSKIRVVYEHGIRGIEC
jgi:hypothetical protein